MHRQKLYFAFHILNNQAMPSEKMKCCRNPYICVRPCSFIPRATDVVANHYEAVVYELVFT